MDPSQYIKKNDWSKVSGKDLWETSIIHDGKKYTIQTSNPDKKIRNLMLKSIFNKEIKQTKMHGIGIFEIPEYKEKTITAIFALKKRIFKSPSVLLTKVTHTSPLRNLENNALTIQKMDIPQDRRAPESFSANSKNIQTSPSPSVDKKRTTGFTQEDEVMTQLTELRESTSSTEESLTQDSLPKTTLRTRREIGSLKSPSTSSNQYSELRTSDKTSPSSPARTPPTQDENKKIIARELNAKLKEIGEKVAIETVCEYKDQATTDFEFFLREQQHQYTPLWDTLVNEYEGQYTNRPEKEQYEEQTFQKPPKSDQDLIDWYKKKFLKDFEKRFPLSILGVEIDKTAQLLSKKENETIEKFCEIRKKAKSDVESFLNGHQAKETPMWHSLVNLYYKQNKGKILSSNKDIIIWARDQSLIQLEEKKPLFKLGGVIENIAETLSKREKATKEEANMALSEFLTEQQKKNTPIWNSLVELYSKEKNESPPSSNEAVIKWVTENSAKLFEEYWKERKLRLDQVR